MVERERERGGGEGTHPLPQQSDSSLCSGVVERMRMVGVVSTAGVAASSSVVGT